MTVTFFGHRDCPEAIQPQLQHILEDLIADGADYFYVGNQGRFDGMVISLLSKLKTAYPQIEYAVVLAYMPGTVKAETVDPRHPTVFPEGLEDVPRRFAITHRNRWMIDASDCVVAYVTHSWGGAAQFIELAEKKGKRVIQIEYAGY